MTLILWSLLLSALIVGPLQRRWYRRRVLRWWASAVVEQNRIRVAHARKIAARVSAVTIFAPQELFDVALLLDDPIEPTLLQVADVATRLGVPLYDIARLTFPPVTATELAGFAP